MFRIAIAVLAVSFLAFGFTACCSTNDSDTDHSGAGESHAGCTCDQGKAGATIWCEDCSVGYVAKEKIACQDCFTAKTGGPACAACAAK